MPFYRDLFVKPKTKVEDYQWHIVINCSLTRSNLAMIQELPLSVPAKWGAGFANQIHKMPGLAVALIVDSNVDRIQQTI